METELGNQIFITRSQIRSRFFDSAPRPAIYCDSDIGHNSDFYRIFMEQMNLLGKQSSCLSPPMITRYLRGLRVELRESGPLELSLIGRNHLTYAPNLDPGPARDSDPEPMLNLKFS
ncbi:hypothetical protein EVAR_16732_1 [Eumeta japonica]|uniref:Uncharacterized protein n=1 Tax=Eumeta variegata TaxID=151549 RepID=A0A4C1V6P2_EUMVA|nr:hypothetical protein EVAR_16732_1 [Eumeta japonica]